MHAAKVQGFKAQEVASMLRAVAEMSWVWPEAFDSLCGAAAAKVQDFNAQDLANTLWAMAATGRVLPEVFDSFQRWQLWKDRESRSLGH